MDTRLSENEPEALEDQEGSCLDYGFSEEALTASIEAQKELWRRAPEMDRAELEALSDDDLIQAVVARQEAKIDEDPALLDRLSPAGQTAYVVFCFDLEAQNGGLSQFFTNSSGVLYPRVAAALRAVGAGWAADLLEETCGGLDLGQDPGETVMEMDDEELEPLDAFDEAYYEGNWQHSVWDDLAAFVRRNLDQL